MSHKYNKLIIVWQFVLLWSDVCKYEQCYWNLRWDQHETLWGWKRCNSHICTATITIAQNLNISPISPLDQRDSEREKVPGLIELWVDVFFILRATIIWNNLNKKWKPERIQCTALSDCSRSVPNNPYHTQEKKRCKFPKTGLICPTEAANVSTCSPYNQTPCPLYCSVFMEWPCMISFQHHKWSISSPALGRIRFPFLAQ